LYAGYCDTRPPFGASGFFFTITCVPRSLPAHGPPIVGDNAPGRQFLPDAGRTMPLNNSGISGRRADASRTKPDNAARSS
jgi:hypothetical protein